MWPSPHAGLFQAQGESMGADESLRIRGHYLG